MKQAQNAQKRRGKNSSRQGGKPNHGAGNRTEQKVRGNPKQLIEKYKTQARDALQAGDRVQAEYFLQFSDHYYRVSAERANQQAERSNNQNNGGNSQNNNDGENRRGRRRGHENRDNGNRGEQVAANAQPATDVDSTPNGAVTPDASELPASIVGGAVDLAETEQPREVRPDAPDTSDISGVNGTADGEAPKPKRRRAPRKPVSDDSVDAASVDEATKPKRRPRRPKTEAEAPLLDAASGGDEAA